MKAHTDKCHQKKKNEESDISIRGEKIQNSKIESLLGVTIDNKLSFMDHVHKIFDKASRKLNAFTQLFSFTNQRNKGQP